MKHVLVYSTNTEDLPQFGALLSEGLPQAKVTLAATPAAAEAALATAEVLYCWDFPPQLLATMPRLEWVQKMGAGIDDLIAAWPLQHQVMLTRTDGRLIAPRMAEYVLAAILCHATGFHTGRRLQQERVWSPYPIGLLRELSIGIAGIGQIGSEIARLLKTLGATVIGWRRSIADAPVDRLYVGGEQFDAFLEQSQVLVLVLPATDETSNLLDARRLSKLPTGAHIVNVGRGSVLDEYALLDALAKGPVAHATLDVFAMEPLPDDHPFWAHGDITVTPHTCGPLIPQDVAPHFIENFKAYVGGRPLKNVVDTARGY